MARFIVSFRVVWVVTTMLVLMSGCAYQPDKSSLGNTTLDPRVVSYNRLGFAYLERDNIERAKRAFVKSLSFNERSPDALHGLALVYQQEGENHLAEKYFREALSEGGQFSVARNNFAAFLYSQQRYAEACQQLERTLVDTLYVNRYFAFENLGLCYIRLGRFPEARGAFERALELNPSSGTASLELAALSYQEQRWVVAWNYLQQHFKVAKPAERSLMLGVRLAEQLGKTLDRQRYLTEIGRLSVLDSMQ